MGEPMTAGRGALLAVLIADTVLLALLELFFLPLRLDGVVLPKLGDFPVPITVVLAAVTTPLLVQLAGKLVRPGLSWIPLVVWVLVIMVMGLTGPGGDLVLLQDWRALLLLAGGALPGALALGGGLAAAVQASAVRSVALKGGTQKGGKGG
ncbi:MAG: hypothetical protein QOI21_5609 [Actinomycetota bacterium]|jgi:hypothetical protein|nr:hypothetical protein [Actinomycetota bacterium]